MTIAQTIHDTLAHFGVTVTLWRGKRVYLSGYGRDINAWIEPRDRLPTDARPADGALIQVTSTWKSTRNALHCKGIKHMILHDLYNAGLLTHRPPEIWQKVALEDRRPVTVHVPSSARDEEPFVWPDYAQAR